MDSYDPFVLILSGQSDLERIMEFAVMEQTERIDIPEGCSVLCRQTHFVKTVEDL